jgi:hypothetical protein
MTHAHADLVSVLGRHLDELGSVHDDRAQNVDVHFDDAELHCQFAQVDRLACEVNAIVVASAKCQQLTAEQLRTMAKGLSEQLTYLEERLVVLEVDREAPEVQMRSMPSRDDVEVRCYFEVHAGRQGISLSRFRKVPGEQRQAIPATFTRDIFFRVCSDLIAAVG